MAADTDNKEQREQMNEKAAKRRKKVCKVGGNNQNPEDKQQGQNAVRGAHPQSGLTKYQDKQQRYHTGNRVVLTE